MQDISLSLVVDNFNVLYIKQDTDRLKMTLQKKYPTKMNWEGDYYLGVTLEWDCNRIHSKEMSIYWYQDKSKKHSSNSNIISSKTTLSITIPRPNILKKKYIITQK